MKNFNSRRRFVKGAVAVALLGDVAPLFSKETSVDKGLSSLAGDGETDDTDALNRLFASVEKGQTVKLDANKVFAIKGTVRIPSNINVQTQNCVFKKIQSQRDGYAIEVYDNVKIDNITLLIANNTKQRGIHLRGSSISVNKISVTSDINGSKSRSKNVALTVGRAKAVCSNVLLNNIVIKNWDYPIACVSLKNSKIENIEILSYRRGFYVRDCVDCQFNNAFLHGLSRNSRGTPGDNGLLIESVLGHKGSRSLHFSNWRIEDSGEHGIRLGGEYTIDSVTFMGIKVYRPGVGPESGGGCGIKVRGYSPNNAFHSNINLKNVAVYDCLEKGANFSSLFIALCDRLNVDNLLINKIKQKTSAQYGISILSSSNINIKNARVLECGKHALRIYTGDEKNYAPHLENIVVTDSVLTNAEKSNSSVVSFEAQAVLFKNIRMERCQMEGGTVAVVALPPKKSGGYDGGELQFSYLSKKVQKIKKSPVVGTSDFLIDMSADLDHLDRIEAKDGSKVNSRTLQYKKITGKWTKHGSQINK